MPRDSPVGWRVSGRTLCIGSLCIGVLALWGPEATSWSVRAGGSGKGTKRLCVIGGTGCETGKYGDFFYYKIPCSGARILPERVGAKAINPEGCYLYAGVS